MSPAFSLRRIGTSAVEIPPITLGTMRLDRASDASTLLADALDLGITNFHCSSEYETFPLFADAFLGLPSSTGTKATIVAKVAAPHFGDRHFSRAAFRSKVQFYLDTLRIEQLHVVQWLLRYDLKDEQGRATIFDESAAEIDATLAELKGQGLIGACVGFPYTAPIAERLVQADFIDGLAVYVNPLEREMDEFVAEAAARGKSTIAIRPFAAGRLFQETATTHRGALEHVFRMPGVATTVVSASSRQHLEALRSAFDDLAPCGQPGEAAVGTL